MSDRRYRDLRSPKSEVLSRIGRYARAQYWKPSSHLINSPEQQVEVAYGLKPSSLLALDGTNEVVPFPNPFMRWLLETYPSWADLVQGFRRITSSRAGPRRFGRSGAPSHPTALPDIPDSQWREAPEYT
jgi:hypothetical protein